MPPFESRRRFQRRAAVCTIDGAIVEARFGAEGVRDFDKYRVDPSVPLMPDFFVPDDIPPPPGVVIGAGSLSPR